MGTSDGKEAVTVMRKPPVTLMHAPGPWLAFLRIVVGLWFVKSMLTKVGWVFIGGILPLPVATERWISFLPKKLAEFASNNPLEWYQEFLTGTVIPNARPFAYMTAYGETAVGLGLTLGLLTGLAAVVGLVIMANYMLASFWMGFCQQGFHLLLIASLVAFLGSKAGRTWGLDGWLRRRFPRSFLVRMPFLG